MVAVFDSAPVPTNKPMPLGFGMVLRFVTADVITHSDGFFAVAFAFEPDSNQAAGVREADPQRIGLNKGDRALLDPAVCFFSGGVTRRDRCKNPFDLLEKAALIAFNLKEIVAAFFNDAKRCFVLIMQGIGGDGFPIEYNLLLDQFLRGFELARVAIAFFLEQCAMAEGTPVS